MAGKAFAVGGNSMLCTANYEGDDPWSCCAMGGDSVVDAIICIFIFIIIIIITTITITTIIITITIVTRSQPANSVFVLLCPALLPSRYSSFYVHQPPSTASRSPSPSALPGSHPGAH
jgi:hypothetical protein